MESGQLIAPSPRIALLGNASGCLFYVGITYTSDRDLVREAIDYAVALAAERKLVCYDRQYGTLREGVTDDQGFRIPEA
jgi:hypothetical protein